MSSVKEALYHSIEGLSDEEAHQTLAFIQQLHEQRDVARILRRLAHHPAFRLPAEFPDFASREIAEIRDSLPYPPPDSALRERRR
jgi:hypothetical protein